MDYPRRSDRPGTLGLLARHHHACTVRGTFGQMTVSEHRQRLCSPPYARGQDVTSQGTTRKNDCTVRDREQGMARNKEQAQMVEGSVSMSRTPQLARLNL